MICSTARAASSTKPSTTRWPRSARLASFTHRLVTKQLHCRRLPNIVLRCKRSCLCSEMKNCSPLLSRNIERVSFRKSLLAREYEHRNTWKFCANNIRLKFNCFRVEFFLDQHKNFNTNKCIIWSFFTTR